jgi:hypothetical protein
MINPDGTWKQREAGPDGGGAEGCPIPLPCRVAMADQQVRVAHPYTRWNGLICQSLT